MSRSWGRQLLFERADVEGYDVEPDGFLAIERLADSGIVQQLHLVTGWFAELERLAPLRLSSGPNVL